MHKTIMAGVAALSLCSLPALAQQASTDVTATLTADQRGIYDEWPEDRRTVYETWPPAHRTYYWSLPADRQDAYWLLTPEQRAQIDAMTPTQRQAAWTSIANQIAAGANNSDTSVAARTAVRTTPGNLTPPPASAMNKTYPVCRGQVQDNCQNPGEGGAPGKSRALNYWPGKPASEN